MGGAFGGEGAFPLGPTLASGSCREGWLGLC